MDNNFVNDEENIASDEASADSSVNSDKESPKPRKRKLVKNCPLPIVLVIVIIAALSILVWKSFFDDTIVGTWSCVQVSEVTETYDTAEAVDTADTADSSIKETTKTYEEPISFTFNNDNTCKATVGTVSIPGSYQLAVDENGNKILSVSIIYSYSPLLYGNYPYKIEGNIFTGRKLSIINSAGEAIYELDRGEQESVLTPFDEFKSDPAIVGEWKSDDLGATYKIEENGTMYLIGDTGIEYKMAYTVMETDNQNAILCKYESFGEQSYSYAYSIEDNILYMNGEPFTKLN